MIIKRQPPKHLRGSYRRKCFMLFISDHDSINTSSHNWSGGSISWHSVIDLKTGSVVRDIHGATWPNFDVIDVDIDPGHAVISGGTFCGKPALLSFTVRPEDLHYLGVDENEIDD